MEHYVLPCAIISGGKRKVPFLAVPLPWPAPHYDATQGVLAEHGMLSHTLSYAAALHQFLCQWALHIHTRKGMIWLLKKVFSSEGQSQVSFSPYNVFLIP